MDLIKVSMLGGQGEIKVGDSARDRGDERHGQSGRAWIQPNPSTE